MKNAAVQYMIRIMRKYALCMCKNKGAVTAHFINTFVWATACFFFSKSDILSLLPWLYSAVCVGNLKERFSHGIIYIMIGNFIGFFQLW